MAVQDMARLLTLDELSEYTQIPKNTLYLYSSRGTGPTALRIGRHLRFRLADVERWLDEQAKSA